MLRCTTNLYDRLYARWLACPEDLLILGKLRPGEKVLDLCGGTGTVAVEALRRGAGRVILLDLNPRCPDGRVLQVRGRAEQADLLMPPGRFDLIVCRQALGYLDLPAVARALRGLLGPHGRFACNNFTRPRWGSQTYRLGGRRFVEASACFGRTVWHLQASPGLGWDVTRFRWHTDDDVRRAFAGWSIDGRWTGKAVYYVMQPYPIDEQEQA